MFFSVPHKHFHKYSSTVSFNTQPLPVLHWLGTGWPWIALAVLKLPVWKGRTKIKKTLIKEIILCHKEIFLNLTILEFPFLRYVK